MEHANAAISIAGKIKRSDLDKLAEAIVDDGAGIDWDPVADDITALEEIEACAKDKRHLFLCASEQPWGRFEALEAICPELGLTFSAQYEAGGEWSPGMRFWHPGMGMKTVKAPQYIDGKSVLVDQEVIKDREWSIAEIGRAPMIDAGQIQAMLDAGTLADELALMTAVHRFPWPIEIVEDDPDITAATEGRAMSRSQWIGHVEYDISKPKTDRTAYRKTVVELPNPPEPPTGRLKQVGPVYNNIVRYVGSFASEAEANQAIEEYITEGRP
jgi:hypothetical protein